MLVIDAANVVGSRPDGWWRERAGDGVTLVTADRGLAERARAAGADVVGPRWLLDRLSGS